MEERESTNEVKTGLSSAGIYRTEMPAAELQGDTAMTPQPSYDWKTYSVPLAFLVPPALSPDIQEAIHAELIRAEEQMEANLCADLFVDGAMGISPGEECFDATCDHCGGYWDRLFATQEEADEWLAQHRALCLGTVPPSLQS